MNTGWHEGFWREKFFCKLVFIAGLRKERVFKKMYVYLTGSRNSGLNGEEGTVSFIWGSSCDWRIRTRHVLTEGNPGFLLVRTRGLAGEEGEGLDREAAHRRHGECTSSSAGRRTLI